MEQLYQDYKDVAEFRMIYIREAHAADSNRPTGKAVELGINEHTNHEERCSTAKLLIDNESFTVPVLIDAMDNATNIAYSAHPDRIFLVRTDGRLVVAADRGPFGFSPALQDVEAWLKEFKDEGAEPELDELLLIAGDMKYEQRQAQAAAAMAQNMEAVVGTWDVIGTDVGDQNPQVMIALEENVPSLQIKHGEHTMAGENFQFDGQSLTFEFQVDGNTATFSGKLEDGAIVGTATMGGEEKEVRWTRR